MLTEEVLYNAYKQFDPEDRGFITAQNLAQVFQQAGYQADPQDYAEMIREYELSGEKIDYEFFRHVLSEAYTEDETSPIKMRKGSDVS